MKTMHPIDRQERQDKVVKVKDDEIRHIGSAALILLAVLLGAMVLIPLAAGFVVLYVAATTVWLFVLKRCKVSRLATLLLIATLLRLPFINAAPQLSPDVYRYRWDAKVFASGTNPYAHTPADSRMATLRDIHDRRIVYPQIATIYPPLAELLFWIWGALGAHLIVFRLLLLLVELMTIALLHRVSPRAGMAWATFPLAIIETIWSGHLDVIGGALLLAAVLLLRRGRAFGGGVAIAAAALTKLIPLPALLALPRDARVRGLGAFVLTVLLVVAPFAAAGPMMQGFGDYVERWSFNSPLFAAADSIVTATNLTEVMKRGFTAVKDMWRLEPLAPQIYRILNDAFIARGLCGLVLLASWFLVLRRPISFDEKMMHVVGLFILLSPTIHPWYWLSIAPLALVLRSKFWLSVAVCAPMSYLAYAGAPWWGMFGSYAVAVIVLLRREKGASFQVFKAPVMARSRF